MLNLLATLPHQQTTGSKVFYNLFTHNDIFSKTTNILQSESELGKQFTHFQWPTEVQWAHGSSSCTNNRKKLHKLLIRWYFTPLRLAKSYSMASPHCWRSCGFVGSLVHFFGLAHSYNLIGTAMWVLLLKLYKFHALLCLELTQFHQALG